MRSIDAKDDLVMNQGEAIEYAKQCANRELGEALNFAIGVAMLTILDEEKEYYLDQSFPDHKLDMLLYVKLLAHLLRRHERLNRIMEGDFSDDWLPQELEQEMMKR